MPDGSQHSHHPPEIAAWLRTIELSDRLKAERDNSPSLKLILAAAHERSVTAIDGLMNGDPTDVSQMVELQQISRLYGFMVDTIQDALEKADEAEGELTNGMSDYQE